METLYIVPFEFSTTVAALCRVGGTDAIRELKGATMLVPDNAAWENLGFSNLYHLFSEHGEHDLKSILKYHVSLCPSISIYIRHHLTAFVYFL
jgi:uncharacterized surface protein with fasciclin (FAS1) repeats